MMALKNPLSTWIPVVAVCLTLLVRMGCAEKGHVINCSSRGYPAVHCPIPPDTAVLDLSLNNIEKVTEKDFSALQGLRKLLLQSNHISSVDRGTFRHNTNLEYLDISHNRLPQISALPFVNLPALKFLDISNNAYQIIDLEPSFGPLDLQVLKLGSPDVLSFSRDSVKRLGDLRLRELHLVTGDFSLYEGGSLKVLHDLGTLSLEVNMGWNLDKLKLMLEDICNSTEALRIMNLDLLQTEKMVPMYDVFPSSNIRSITLQNISTSGNYCAPLLSSILKSRIEEFKIETVHTVGMCFPIIGSVQKFYLRKITLKDFDNPRFIFFIPQPTIERFVQVITDFSVINLQQYFFSCELSDSVLHLKTLNLSMNALQEETMFPSCRKPFPVLQSLVIDHNRFQQLGFLGNVTAHMKDLVNFSASYNKIHLEPRVTISWTKSLKRLNLRGNLLSDDVFMHLPETLEMLDLSENNDIQVVTNLLQMKDLAELHLSGNQIKSIGDLPLPASVQFLYLDRNNVTAISVETLKSFRLTELDFSGNPMNCDCDTQQVSQYCQGTSVTILNWPARYRCQTPASLKGLMLEHVSFSWPSCHKGPFALIVILCGMIVVIICCILYRNQRRRQYNAVENALRKSLVSALHKA